MTPEDRREPGDGSALDRMVHDLTFNVGPLTVFVGPDDQFGLRSEGRMAGPDDEGYSVLEGDDDSFGDLVAKMYRQFTKDAWGSFPPEKLSAWERRILESEDE